MVRSPAACAQPLSAQPDGRLARVMRRTHTHGMAHWAGGRTTRRTSQRRRRYRSETANACDGMRRWRQAERERSGKKSSGGMSHTALQLRAILMSFLWQ